MEKRHYFFLLVIAQLFGSFSYAQNPVATELTKLQKDAGLKHAAWSFFAMYADSKDTIAKYNEQIALPPASVMKVVSTSAALQILGSEYTFKTTLYIRGNITADGILNGDLIIRGGGDPTLGSEKWKESIRDTLLMNVFRILKGQNIKMINGNIIADASIYEELMAPPGWNWGDIGNYYGAGPSGLTICDNLVVYCFKSGKTGDQTNLFRMVPDVKDVQIRNYVTAGGTGDNAYVFGSEYASLRYIRGTIPANSDSFCVKGNMPDPPKFAGIIIKEYLEKMNFPILGKVLTDRELTMPINYKNAELKEIGKLESPKLSSIISVVNLFSNNLYAEHVHKSISAYKTGIGSNGSSNNIITDYWVAKGLDPAALFISDGSGLSRSNAISTANLVKLLDITSRDKTGEAFRNSLPVAGQSGTLRNLCKNTKAQGNLIAKTMSRIKSYAGYVKTASGKPVIFAMTFNNYSCPTSELTDKIEVLMVKMAELK
jgi:serine-type D-Ala-D-Ala carboxypeptidase/endopeptidase (penicillin-binding protein 4)